MTGYIVIAAKYIYCTKYAWHFKENQVAHTHLHTVQLMLRNMYAEIVQSKTKTKKSTMDKREKEKKCEQTMGRD